MSVAIHPARHATAASDAALVAKAAGRAAAALGLKQAELAAILGISQASASRLAAGSYAPQPQEKSHELALLLIRLYRSLAGAFGPDEAMLAAWMRTPNLALRGTPAELVRSAAGLVQTLAYADAARARV
jgi:transcriptional regulator with XRE-family HTH domain